LKKAYIAIILVALILSASAIGAYSIINTSSPSPSPTPTASPTNTPTAAPTQIITPNPTDSTTTTPTATPTAAPTAGPSSVATPTASPSPSPSPSPTPYVNPLVVQQGTNFVVLKDSYGNNVNITLPVKRIVCITSGLNEILFALGAGDKVVGRDQYTTTPSSALKLPIVATSSATPNTELIVQLNPDLIIADTMLNNATKATFESTLKVPVLVQSPSSLDVVIPLVNAFGIVTDKKQTSADLIQFMNNVTDLVATRLKGVTDSQKPLVYYEWSKAWYSSSSIGLPNQMIVAAGGKNLAANETVTYPSLSPEYILQRNPDIIVRSLSDTNHNITEYITLRNEIMSRTALVATKAVQTGRVYILSSTLRTGITNPIGTLTMAKWFYPTLFTDVDPTAIQAQMIQKFFNETLTGTYSYSG
jgi:iron complex transport system substrate-binding protein